MKEILRLTGDGKAQDVEAEMSENRRGRETAKTKFHDEAQ